MLLLWVGVSYWKVGTRASWFWGGTHENKVVRWVSSVHRVARGSRGVMGEGLGKGLLLTTRSALP